MSSGGNGGDARQTGWDGCQAFFIGTPGDHGPIAFES